MAAFRWLVVVWLVTLGLYGGAAVFFEDDAQARLTFGNIVQCLVPLFASLGLLANAGTPNWRRNSFWMLLAVSCALWLSGQLMWTYFELHLKQAVPNPFIGDVVFFLHAVPAIAALGLRPHARRADASLKYAYLDFALLLLWWVYLYAFTVIPWQFVHPDVGLYGDRYNVLHALENSVFALGAAYFWWSTTGAWRIVYGHLFGAAMTYVLGSLCINVAIDLSRYSTGSLYDLPLIASFLWKGTAGFVANRLMPTAEQTPVEESSKSEANWPTRVAMAAVVSLPVMALWALFHEAMPDRVRAFRLILTLVAMVLFTSLLFLRQQLVDRERLRILHSAQNALRNLRRLQAQFVQSEKLASLGQLAAGAAHEINNPLTAIIGYTDLLTEDQSMGERPRSMVEKIRDQARRTKALLGNLMSFARPSPGEKSLLDINPLVNNAVQLRMLDLRAKNIRVHLQTEAVLPGVRCDANQMLQVFFNIIRNAVDAMEETGGGSLTIRTLRDKSNVVVEFSDTGPGVKEPQSVFDPFYTTKPVGKGSGLGLSICYGIIQEHGGSISCYNRHQGGATFRIELPAVTAVLPKPAFPSPAKPAPTD
jgi:signal transduction histidine kinase